MTGRGAATPDEFPALARLWEAGWHDAHDACVPPALVALRTAESFLCRLHDLGDALRVAGPPGAPIGLCVAHGDEIDQLTSRRRRAARGLPRRCSPTTRRGSPPRACDVGRLVCAIGNDRALRFYGKHGWAGGRRDGHARGFLRA